MHGSVLAIKTTRSIGPRWAFDPFIHHIMKHTCPVKLQAAMSLLTRITNQIAKNN